MINLRTSKVILVMWYANKPAIHQFINSIGMPSRILIIPIKSIKKIINDIVARMILNHCAKAHILPSSQERNWKYDKNTRGVRRNNVHKSLSSNFFIRCIEVLAQLGCMDD